MKGLTKRHEKRKKQIKKRKQTPWPIEISWFAVLCFALQIGDLHRRFAQRICTEDLQSKANHKIKFESETKMVM